MAAPTNPGHPFTNRTPENGLLRWLQSIETALEFCRLCKRGLAVGPSTRRLSDRDGSPVDDVDHCVADEPDSQLVQLQLHSAQARVALACHRSHLDDVPRVEPIVYPMHRTTHSAFVVPKFPERWRHAAILRHLAFVQVERAQFRNREQRALEDRSRQCQAEIGSESCDLCDCRLCRHVIDFDDRHLGSRKERGPLGLPRRREYRSRSPAR